MKILVKSEVSQESRKPFYRNLPSEPDDNHLKSVFKKSLKKFGEHESEKYEWIDDETVVVKGVSGLALHNFAVEAEAMGRGIVYEQQTIIHIK